MAPLDVCDNQVDPVGEELDLVEVSHEDFGGVVVAGAVRTKIKSSLTVLKVP